METSDGQPFRKGGQMKRKLLALFLGVLLVPKSLVYATQTQGVEITVTVEEPEVQYNITVSVVGKGNVYISADKAAAGEVVTLSVEGLDGYEFSHFVGCASDGTLIMPEHDVMIKVYFTKVKKPIPVPQVPTRTPVPTNTPIPTSTPITTNTPKATITPVPTRVPTVTPKPTYIPRPTWIPVVTNTPVPTATVTPKPTSTPVLTATIVPTNTPEPTVTIVPSPTLTPMVTSVPTNIPSPSATPELTQLPTPTEKPIITPTKVPVISNVPAPTEIPSVSNIPEIVPVLTATPSPTVTPVLTIEPTQPPTLMPTELPEELQDRIVRLIPTVLGVTATGFSGTGLLLLLLFMRKRRWHGVFSEDVIPGTVVKGIKDIETKDNWLIPDLLKKLEDNQITVEEYIETVKKCGVTTLLPSDTMMTLLIAGETITLAADEEKFFKILKAAGREVQLTLTSVKTGMEINMSYRV